MIRRVKLYARINHNGQFSRVPVQFKNDQPISPKGKVTSYAVRIAGQFQPAGEDLLTAVSILRQRQAQIGAGIYAAPLTVENTTMPDRIRLADAAAKFIADLQILDKNKHTIDGYRSGVNCFVVGCRKGFVDEIERADILSHIQWLRDNLEVRLKGGQNETIRHRLNILGVFLNKQGVRLFKLKNRNGAADPGLLFYDDRPKVMKKKPKKYPRETIDLLLNAANTEEKDYLLFLLWSGFRDEEVQYLEYSDFNWRGSKVTVQAKPHWGWKPKDSEERVIDLPTAVSQRMKDRMLRHGRKDNDLVFPAPQSGRPDCHLLYRLHAVAARIGLNLRGKMAGHMFRKNAGSRVAKNLGIRAAMNFLGHSNMGTTERYLAADEPDAKRTKQVFDEMYANGD